MKMIWTIESEKKLERCIKQAINAGYHHKKGLEIKR